MNAGYKKGQGAYLKDVELRRPGAGEIKIRVNACGICGSDLKQNPAETAEGPFGHEVAGAILELGAGTTGLKVGQKVALDSATACGRCANCRNARQELCSDIQHFWNSASLGLAEEMVAPAISAIPCDDLPPDVACLQEPLGVAIDMVRLADINVTSNVLVMGAGPIGLMAIALVKRAGARKIFVSQSGRRAKRRELALKFGADAVIDPARTPLEKYDFGCGIDRVLVTAPPGALPSAIRIASKGGIISFIGIEHGAGAQCSFDANEFHFKKLQLRASFASPALFGPLALQFLREGVVDGNALITHRFPLSRIAEAYETALNDASAVKVVVTR